MAPRRDQKKRMGKKHRQASTRPKLGKAPRTGAQMANVAPKKRKALSSKKAAEAKAARTPRQSPERERAVRLDPPRTERDHSRVKGHGSHLRPEQERETEIASERRNSRATLRLGG
jgi:GTP-binding protein